MKGITKKPSLKIIIIWCSKDSGDINASSILLSESRQKHAYGHCRILLPWLRVPCWFFCNLGLKNCLHVWAFEPTVLNLSSQSGAFDHSATVNPVNLIEKDFFIFPYVNNEDSWKKWGSPTPFSYGFQARPWRVKLVEWTIETLFINQSL